MGTHPGRCSPRAVRKNCDARRTIPLGQRTADILEIHRSVSQSTWVFQDRTHGGLKKSALKRQHPKACKIGNVEAFPLYTFRHTCLTRWAGHMDPYTLAYLAGHRDFFTTRRYVHPQTQTVLRAIERSRGKPN